MNTWISGCMGTCMNAPRRELMKEERTGCIIDWKGISHVQAKNAPQYVRIPYKIEGDEP